MTVQIYRTATIIAFRAHGDVNNVEMMRDHRRRVAEFSGVLLGTTADGFDLVAAFHGEAIATRFLRAYYVDDPESAEPIGYHVISDATI